MEIYLGIVLLMSVITFIMYYIDKKRAIHHEYRIKEVTLLLLSIFFGALGGTICMYSVRHKTNHWYFVLINFLFLVIHIIIGIYIFKSKGFLLF